MPVIKRTIWVAVGNGAGYRIFSCRKVGGAMELVHTATSPEALKATSELGSDRPGRSQAAPGQARHGFENKADWHEQAERDFAKTLGVLLNNRYREKKFDRLLVVAPAKTLGEVRTHLPAKDLGNNLIEMSKDLTNLSIHELQRYLEKHF